LIKPANESGFPALAVATGSCANISSTTFTHHQLRKELGVWYTPPEIVRYMVARVDRVLREEPAIPDGLADNRMVILDPCCGTGAYCSVG
jgi:predicted helicase